MADKITAARWVLHPKNAIAFQDEVICVVSQDNKTLHVVQNVLLPGTQGSTAQWAYQDIDLNFDGYPHSVRLSTKENSNIHKESFFDIDDGTLHYSAVVSNGVPLIAFRLEYDTSYWNNADPNGDGVYKSTDIVGTVDQVAGSIQNMSTNLINAGIDLVQAFFGGGAVEGGAALAQLVTAHPDYGTRDPAEIKRDIVEEITSKGFNEYYSRIGLKPKKTNTNISSDTGADTPTVNTTTMAMIGGLGLVLLMILFVAKK